MDTEPQSTDVTIASTGRSACVLARLGETTRTLVAGGRGWTLSSVAFGWFLVVGTMLALSAVLPHVKTTYGIDNATAGLAVSLLWIAYTATQFTAGLLTDRLGERATLVSVKGVAPAAAALFGLLFTVAAVTQPLAGFAAAEVGDRVVLVSITVLYALVLAALPFVRGAAVPLLVVILGTQRGTVPVVNAYVAAVLPEDVRGTSYGLLRTVFTGVAATGAVVVGVFADAGLFDEAFLALGALAAVAGGAYVLLPPRDQG